MPRTDTSPAPYYLALVVAILAWLVGALCFFLAVKFRVAPVLGDESDIAVGVVFALSLPVLGGSMLFALPRRISQFWRVVLVSPGILAVTALLVTCLGVTTRP